MKKRNYFSTFSPFIFSLPIGLPAGRCCRAGSRIVHRPLLAETTAVAFSCICRFEFCLLRRRNEVCMLLEIFDDLFADHFPLKASQCRFDRFVRIYCNICHLSSHPLSAKDTLPRANHYLTTFRHETQGRIYPARPACRRVIDRGRDPCDYHHDQT